MGVCYLTTKMVLLALLDHLQEEFKNEPDYEFELIEFSAKPEYDIIISQFKEKDICHIKIIGDNIIVNNFTYMKKCLLSSPDCFKMLNDEIKKTSINPNSNIYYNGL